MAIYNDTDATLALIDRAPAAAAAGEQREQADVRRGVVEVLVADVMAQAVDCALTQDSNVPR